MEESEAAKQAEIARIQQEVRRNDFELFYDLG